MKSFLLSPLLLLSINASAQEIELDDIMYSVDNGVATMEYVNPMADSISKIIVIPSSVTYNGKQYPVKIIGKEAFRFAEIESITIPNSVDSIAPKAFFRCQKLTTVKLPNGLKHISEGMFFGCSSIVNIVLPDSIKMIDGFAFQGCSSLETIDVPDGCELIGDFCFYECHSLQRVVLGQNVKSIGDKAFYRVFKLEEIVVKALMPPSFKTTMDYYLYKKRVVVPADAVEVYRKDENWSRMELIPDSNIMKTEYIKSNR